MGLRIFEDDPDAKPAPKVEYERPDIAYNFRSGMKGEDGKGVSLPEWRVVTDSEEVGDAIAELLGGTAREFDPSKEQHIEVMTAARSVEIVIDGSAAIEDKLVKWEAAGGPSHECDGKYFLSPPEDKGEPCGCPKTMAERKDRARKNRGPKPAINISFRLAGAGYDLGVGKYIGTSWSLAEVIDTVKDALDDVAGEALCSLTLEPVEYVSKIHGPVSYTKPVLRVLGSYSDAIAEPA